ncbi:MAG: glycosyltransferase family 4 protein [Planctomycetes bacterium]|nr:glycosyltransferase family 4 protein [Planctomycetota bacterium]
MSTPGNAAIYYLSGEYSTQRKQLMGRHAANESFIHAWLKHAPFGDLSFYGRSNEQDALKSLLSEHKRSLKNYQLIPQGQENRLKDPGCLYIPDPNLAQHAWHRRTHGAHHYSLSGVTHTLSSKGAQDLIGALLTAPVYPWDALVCTSKAVKASVLTSIESYGEYLRERFTINHMPQLPQLPVIPLGIHSNQYHADEEKKTMLRNKWHERLQIDKDTTVFLFVGRLSFHAKANPIAMLKSLEQSSRASKKKVCLIQSGWFANEKVKEAYEKANHSIAPNVQCVYVDGRNAQIKEEIWHAADVFMSLSDNIQETFGLTPIEAMAASLPVIVSDWDGYKDTVRHGIDGLRIPTLTPPPGLNTYDAAYRFDRDIDNYDFYIGSVSLDTTVHIPSCTKACIQMINSPSLRKKMGQQGRERAVHNYDWQAVIPQYLKLWQNLAQIRQHHQDIFSHKKAAHPLRQDPALTFAAWPTRTLSLNDFFSLTLSNKHDTLKKFEELYEQPILNYAHDLPHKQLFHKVIDSFNEGSAIEFKALLGKHAKESHHMVIKGVSWLLKVGLIDMNEL